MRTVAVESWEENERDSDERRHGSAARRRRMGSGEGGLEAD